MSVARRYPVIEGVRLLAIKALGSEVLPDEDRQLLIDLIRALPKAETLADWSIQDSWSIQVGYPFISEDVRAGLQVMVEPNGLEASVTEIFKGPFGSDLQSTRLVTMYFDEPSEEGRLRAAEEGAFSADLFLDHVRMIDAQDGYTFVLS